MYLSRLALNPCSRDARRDERSAYEMHSTLQRVFANAPQGSERVLFRIEQSQREYATKVLILSRTPPDFRVLPANYALSIDGPKTYKPALRQGQQLAFRLLANPTVKRKNQKGEPARKPLLTDEEQAAWLKRKLGDTGASVLSYSLDRQSLVTNHKHALHAEEGKQIHHAVLFEGILTVTNPIELHKALETGIGSAKGYGFGLLSLAPA